MKGNFIKYIIFIAVAGVVYYFFLRSPKSNEGKVAPDFTADLINGESFNLSDLKGEYVLLDFWGSWCPPCRKDNPNLVKLHDAFNGKKFKDATGFNIVTVAVEKDDRRWKKAAEKDGFKWKYQIVQTAKIVLMSSLAQKYSVKNLPSKFLIDPNGNIVGVNQSYVEIQAFLNSKL